MGQVCSHPSLTMEDLLLDPADVKFTGAQMQSVPSTGAQMHAVP